MANGHLCIFIRVISPVPDSAAFLLKIQGPTQIQDAVVPQNVIRYYEQSVFSYFFVFESSFNVQIAV